MFKASVEVYYDDTDCGGVVYHANYLNFFERARTQLFKSVGVFPAEWMKKDVIFAVIRANTEYKGPAFYGDTLEIETAITDVRGARLSFTYSVKRGPGGPLIVTGRTDMACVSSAMKPIKIPDEILDRILPITERAK